MGFAWRALSNQDLSVPFYNRSDDAQHDYQLVIEPSGRS